MEKKLDPFGVLIIFLQQLLAAVCCGMLVGNLPVNWLQPNYYFSHLSAIAAMLFDRF